MQKQFMREAIRMAIENVATGKGGPFAALIVCQGKIIGRGTNIVTSSNDPTAHAEIVAIRDASQAISSFQLSGCDLYTTCEPCPMCMGAIYWARPQKVYYAATRTDAAKVGFDDEMIYTELALPPSQRRIPMTEMLRSEGAKVFEQWEASTDRIDY